MRDEKKVKVRFFLTHFAIIIPILIASFLITYVISYETLKQNHKNISRQLDSFAENLLDMYSEYKGKGLLLAGKPELSAEKMTVNPIDAYKGIELLNLSNYFDEDLFSIFISYQTGKIYSTTGATRNSIYFRNVINCSEESAKRGDKILSGDKDTITLLYKGSTDGYILLSYKEYFRKDFSVNFLIPFEKLKKICAQQLYSSLYYELEMEDGSRLLLENDPTGMVTIHGTDCEKIFSDRKYNVMEKQLNDIGITARLYYDKFSFQRNKWLYTIQVINIVLIFIGTVWAGILSWSLTQRRLREIADLEKIASGNSQEVLQEKNIYSGLQSILSKGWNENQQLERSVLEHKQKLQNKIAYMIFGGLYSDSEKVNQAFRELGFFKCPECFFTGLISAQTECWADQIPEVFGNCLWMEVEYEGQQCLLFLYELDTEDKDKLRRRQIAQTIRTQLHQVDIRKVRIGMSSVFTEIVLINRAYTEAEKVLEEILSGKRKDFFLCWDEIEGRASDIFFDENLLKEFDKALQDQNYDDAVYCFQKMMKNTSSRECSLQNRMYLRYVILQHLIQCLQEKETTESAIYVKECIHVDVTAEKEFMQTVTSILYQCFSKKEDDAFAKMQEFISTHYQNSELTYEEVAAAGGISKTYISKVFRAKLDMSYIEYLTAVRMDKACTLLRTTNVNISEVAHMVGYANDSSFRRVFKECFGVSASDFRKRERE